MNQPVRDTLRAKPKSEAVVDEAGIATDAESSESPTETAGLIGPRERRKTMVSEQRDSPADPAPSPPAKPDQSVTAQAEPTALPVVRTRPELPAAQVIARATPPAAVREDQPVQLEKTTASPADTRQEKITELLALGHKALKRDRLLIPTHDSAYKYYQQALILEPGNDAALLGIERIVARYNVLARKALDKQNEDEGRLYINRGLSINPTDKRLLALRESVNTPTTVAEPESPPVIPVEERAPVAERKAEPNDFLSRLKALFTKKRPTDKRREVVVEER